MIVYTKKETFCKYMAHLLTKEKMYKKAEISPEVQKFIEEVKTINKYKHPDRTQRLKDILRDKFTSCWGISRLALNRLRKAKLDPETVFIYEDDVPGLPTHQFTTFKDGKKYRVHDYWFNNREQIGDAFSTREEAIDDRVKRWRQEENHFNPVHAYTGTHLPKPGVDSPEYMYRIMNLAKLLKTYPKLDK